MGVCRGWMRGEDHLSGLGHGRRRGIFRREDFPVGQWLKGDEEKKDQGKEGSSRSGFQGMIRHIFPLMC